MACAQYALTMCGMSISLPTGVHRPLTAAYGCLLKGSQTTETHTGERYSMKATAKHHTQTEVTEDGIFVRMSKQALRTLAALDKPLGKKKRRILRHYGEEYHLEAAI